MVGGTPRISEPRSPLRARTDKGSVPFWAPLRVAPFLYPKDSLGAKVDKFTQRVSDRCMEIASVLEIIDPLELGDKISVILDRDDLNPSENLELIRRLASWRHADLAVQLSIRIAWAVKEHCVSAVDIAHFVQCCPFSTVEGVRTNLLPSIVLALDDLSSTDPASRQTLLSYCLEASYAAKGSIIGTLAAKALIRFLEVGEASLTELEEKTIRATLRFLWKFGERHLRRELPTLHKLAADPKSQEAKRPIREQDLSGST